MMIKHSLWQEVVNIFYFINLTLEIKTNSKSKLLIMFHHNGFPFSDFLLIYTHFSELMFYSVVNNDDFEGQKAFHSNAEKRKENRSLMSNDYGEDDYL